jgi:hypothetical protein
MARLNLHGWRARCNKKAERSERCARRGSRFADVIAYKAAAPPSLVHIARRHSCACYARAVVRRQA